MVELTSTSMIAGIEQVDAIVVGSGISGGWAAKELAEKGLKVLMLERGKPLTHGLDYVGGITAMATCNIATAEL